MDNGLSVTEIAGLVERFGVPIAITIFFLGSLVLFFTFLAALTCWMLKNAVKPVVDRHVKFVDALEGTIKSHSDTLRMQAENAAKTNELVGTMDNKIGMLHEALNQARCRMVPMLPSPENITNGPPAAAPDAAVKG